MSRYVQDGENIDFVASGALVAGTLVQIAGKVGILNPKPDGTDIVSGDLVSARVTGIVAIPYGSGSFTDGEAVGYDQSLDTAVESADVNSDFDAGKAVGAQDGSSGEILVLLNA